MFAVKIINATFNSLNFFNFIKLFYKFLIFNSINIFIEILSTLSLFWVLPFFSFCLRRLAVLCLKKMATSNTGGRFCEANLLSDQTLLWFAAYVIKLTEQ